MVYNKWIKIDNEWIMVYNKLIEIDNEWMKIDNEGKDGW